METIQYTDLSYLKRRTKEDPSLMMEMISIYLEQTPALIESMKASIVSQDWETLHAAVHKMIPSFSIMGIHNDFEKMAIRIKEYAGLQEKAVEINEMISKLEAVSNQACKELIEVLNNIKASENEK